MELELQIVGDPYRDVDKKRRHVFAETGGSVGRAPDNDWPLPDPKCYVSGRHFELEFHAGAFWVRDQSRNGVFLNGGRDRVGYGRQVMLHDGDRIRLGLYELAVRVRDPEHREVSSSVVDTSPDTRQASGNEGVATRTDGTSAAAFHDLAAGQRRTTHVVSISNDELRRLGLVAPESQERLIANQFRHIKRALVANAFGRAGAPAVPKGRLLVVTSSLPGEGKTFSTWNLAVSLAREKGVEVLLVDADVAKPHISGLLKIQSEPGLLEALQDDSIEVESLILPTSIPGLSMLPAGRCDEDLATELLASPRMEQVVRRLEGHAPNRIVVFDSPPILLTNEARVLASVAGQIVLVVRAGHTPQQAVIEALSYVSEDRPVGLVLNQTKATAPGSYYGYGSYGYGAYGPKSSEEVSSGDD